MKSSTELINAADEAVKRLVKRNITEKGKPDRYAVGAIDGYLQGYCDGVAESINIDNNAVIGLMEDEIDDFIAGFRKEMTEQNE